MDLRKQFLAVTLSVAATVLQAGIPYVTQLSGKGTNETFVGPSLWTGDNYMTNGEWIGAPGQVFSNANGFVTITGGKIGIQNMNPARKIHVSGAGWSTAGGTNTGDLLVSASGNFGATIGLQSTASAGHLWNFFSCGPSGLVGPGAFTIRDDTPGLSGQYRFVIDTNGTMAVGQAITDSALSGANMVVLGTGNVGINTNTPGVALDVVGRGAFTKPLALWTNTPCPVPVIFGGWLWNSNNALFWVTGTKTNLVSDGR
jgi:hypothetical protein